MTHGDITALKQRMVLSNCYIHDLETKFDHELLFISRIKAEYLVYYTKKPSKIYIRDTQIFIYTCLFPSCNTFPKMKQIVIMLHEPQSG